MAPLKSNSVTVVVGTGGNGGKVQVSVSQPGGPGTAPKWAITGLTPGASFSVYEQVSSVGPSGGRVFFTDNFVESADAAGTDTRTFDAGPWSPGNVVGLQVTDTASGNVGGTTYTLQ